MNKMKKGYKRTEIGVIPVDWEVKNLGEFTTIKGGFAFTSNYFSDKGPILITPGNFKLNGGLYFNQKNTKRYLGSYSSKMTFKSGDLLIVMTDLTPDCNLLGKPAFVYTKEIVLHNQRIGKILVQDNIISSKYLYWLMLSPLYLSQIKDKATGSTVRHTSNSSVYSSNIPLPPLPEQKAIAEVLSDTDNLIQALEKRIAKKRLIKQGAMQKLLTPKDDWEKISIFELADRKKELFDDGDWIEAEFLTDSGIRLIQTGNIGKGYFIEKGNKKYISHQTFKKLKCKKVLEGDILICRLAEPAGRACLFPYINEDKVITSVDVTMFRPIKDKVNRTFLVNIFNTEKWFNEVNERCGGSTRTRIARGALGKIRIKIPKLKEQTHIATILSNMDSEIEALEKKLAKYQQLKQGLMQNLLTGKIRLI